MATARLILDNVTEQFLPAFKELAKAANVDFKVDKSEKKPKIKVTSKDKAGKKAKELEFYELETMPIRKDIEKWAKENPKIHQQTIKEVKHEMGLQ